MNDQLQQFLVDGGVLFLVILGGLIRRHGPLIMKVLKQEKIRQVEANLTPAPAASGGNGNGSHNPYMLELVRTEERLFTLQIDNLRKDLMAKHSDMHDAFERMSLRQTRHERDVKNEFERIGSRVKALEDKTV